MKMGLESSQHHLTLPKSRALPSAENPVCVQSPRPWGLRAMWQHSLPLQQSRYTKPRSYSGKDSMGTLQPGSLRSTYCHTRVGFEVRNNFAIESHKHSAECASVALTMLSPAHKGHLRLGRKKGQEGRNRHSCTGQPRRPVVAWDSAEFLSACKLPC